MEEALYESPALRRFVGVDLGSAPTPDETTILRFRHLLERFNIGPELLGTVNLYLESKGIRITTGTIVDATIIQAPSSTKNSTGQRDPGKRGMFPSGFSVFRGTKMRTWNVSKVQVRGERRVCIVVWRKSGRSLRCRFSQG